MATKTTSAKTRATPAKAAPEAAPEVVEEAEAKVATVTLKLKALLDLVADKSEAKKKDVKAVVEATLLAVGSALARGEGVSLPGLGHLRVARKGENGMMTVKLRPMDPAPREKAVKAEGAEKETLAEVGEAG